MLGLSWVKNASPKYPSISELFKAMLRSSMYILNKMREIIPPCFTPLATVNCVEIVVPQRTTNFLCVQQKHNSLITNKGTHFLTNLSNISSNLIYQKPY